MKASTFLITLFVGFLVSSITAQETTWFDTNWKITTKDKASFYRPSPQKKEGGYWIVDYYKDGTKQMEGFSKNAVLFEEKFEGLVQYYHVNGKPFHKANYKDGKLEGKREVYYQSGNLKEEGKYKEGNRDGVWKTYYENGKIKTRGKYKDGEKVGVWKTFYKNL